MPRPTRIEYPGALYHIYVEAMPDVRIFQDDIDRNRFLQILDYGIKRYSLKLHAFCLMNDSYRLLLETPMGNLTKALQYINSHYMAYINTRHRISGRLFKGRYKSPVVDKSRYLLKITRHIHLIPVYAGLAHHPDRYRWTSHYKYALPGDQIPAVFTRDVLGKFSGSPNRCKRKYKDYVESGINLDYTAMEKMLLKQRIIGGPDFIEFVKKESERPPLATISPTKVIDAIAAYYSVSVESITNNRKKPNIPRNIAIYLCRNVTTIPLEELGDLFAVGPSSICNTAKRVEANRKSDKQLDRTMLEIERKIRNSNGAVAR